MNPTAIIYARVSSVSQAQEELPIASQVDQCQRKAASLGATVVRVFKDEGLSGRTTRRPEFLRAREYCLAHEVKYFIVWNSARFARSKADSAMEKSELRRAGTQIVYASSDIHAETDEGWLAESIIEVFDEQYSRTIAKDTRRSMIKNAEDGNFNGGRVPFGYHVVDAGKRRRLEIDEEEAPVVRRIFEMYASGSGCRAIAITLNEEGVRKRGAKWTKTNVGLLLKNHRYIGLAIFNRRSHHERITRAPTEWITTASHAPIVTRDQFEAVQGTLESRAPRSGQGSPLSQHVFTGMLRCHCGASMKIESATGRTRRYAYYNCSAAMIGRGCEGRRINAEKFDSWMMDVMFERLFTPERVAAVVESIHLAAGKWIKERQGRRDILTREKRAAEARLARLFDLLELRGTETPNLADVTVRLRELKAQIAELNASLDSLDVPPELPREDIDVAGAAGELRAIVRACGSPEKQRLFFAGFIQSIEATDEDVTVKYLPGRLLDPELGTSVVHSKERWLPELGSNQRPAD
ncbi:MAG: recombinase family protein [Burkholderiales bacterium]